jgi:hypothetical protein
MKRKWRQLIEYLILKFKTMENFDSKKDIEASRKIEDLNKRLDFLENRITDFRQSRSLQFPIIDPLWILQPYVRNINIEIEATKSRIQNPIESGDKEKGLIKAIKPKSKKYSYQWLGKPDELKELFESMKGNFLSNDNKLDDFVKVFSNVEVNPNFKPIRWNNDVASEVLFFIKILREKGLIEKSNRMDYTQLQLLFVKPDGNRFDGDLKVSYNRLDIDFSPNKQKELSNLLNGFL